MAHSHCPECNAELVKGFLDIKFCPNDCTQYCQQCGKKMHLAPGLDYYCEDCPVDLKDLMAALPPKPMEYPGVAVAVIIFTSNPHVVGRISEFYPRERVLIGKRKGPLGTGLYSLPGGKVDYGETPVTAVLREVKEETNLDLSSIRFTGILTNDYFPEKGKQYLCMYYIATADNLQDLKVLEDDKVEAWEWHDVEHLPEMWGNTKALIESCFTSGLTFENPEING